MSKHKPVPLVFVLFLSCIIVVAVNRVWADEGHGHNHHDDGGDSTASADSVLDNVIKDSSTSVGLGFSYGMGDVDINEGQNCMGSEQKANVLFGKQKMALNAWCASLFYELNGKHNFAAKLRCGIPEIASEYDSKDKCVVDQDLSPGFVGPLPTAEHDEDFEVVQMAQVDLESRIQALEQKPAPRPRIVQQAAPEPYMTLAEKEEVLALLFAGDDEDE